MKTAIYVVTCNGNVVCAYTDIDNAIEEMKRLRAICQDNEVYVETTELK